MNHLREVEPTFTGLTHAPAPQYECPICEDKEFNVYKKDDGNEWGSPCECVEARKARRLLQKSGIDEEFAGKNFANFTDRGFGDLIQAKQKAQKYLNDFTSIEGTRINSLLLCGQVGSGKTHLCMSVANALLKNGIAVRYIEYVSAMGDLKRRITEKEYEEQINKYKNARVLFIDDLLKRVSNDKSDADARILFDIINHRYLKKMPMIVSTERTITELIDFDEAIASRILEMSKGRTVQLQGRHLNYRLR